MSTDLKKELLDHFMEEHQEWRVELLGPDAPAHGAPGQKAAVSFQSGAAHGGGPQSERSQSGASHSGASNQPSHTGGGKPSHSGHGSGSSHGGGHSSHSGHSGQSGQSGQSSHSSGAGSSGPPKPSYGPNFTGQARSKPREEKDNSGTTGATKGNWTVGPLWPQGG
ncbi:MAG: hypothetical protein IAF58_06485 [Leptolyngbya sp.]|nr:hypothetical protein [Candidatus Melainabacteria bacterium]